MAKDKLTDYDAVAANNTDIGGVNTSETMLPSEVNDAFRELASHLKDFAAGTSGINVLSLTDDTDTNQIKLQAPASVTSTVTFTLPDGDGTNGQTMITDGAGTLTWGDAGGGANTFTVFEYTATSGQTTFSGADDNAATLSYSAGNVVVLLNGVTLDPSDYTATSGTSIVLSSGASAGDEVNVYAYATFSVADTVPASTGGEFSAPIGLAGVPIYENSQTVTVDYTISNGRNAMSAGPITLNTGVTVTVGTGETWTVV